MKKRLFFKIFASYCLLVIVMGVVLDLMLTPYVRHRLMEHIEHAMRDKGTALSLMSFASLEERLQQLSRQSSYRITLIDARGNVIADTESSAQEMDNHLYRPEVQEARLKGQGKAVRYSRTTKENFLYMAFPVTSHGEIMGYVRLARNLKDLRHLSEGVTNHIHLVILVVLIPALILSLFFSAHLYAPWKGIARLTEQLQKGEGPLTVAIDQGDELDRLTGGLNAAIKQQFDELLHLRKENEHLQGAFNAMTEGIALLSDQDLIIRVNRAICELWEKRDDDLVGRSVIEAFHHATCRDGLQKFRATGEMVREVIALREEGDPKFIELSISPLHEGETRGRAVIVFRDVTRLKKLERVRQDFIANVTHELKTPLAAVIGYTEMLLDNEGSDQDKKKVLTIVYHHAVRLNRLVDDLLLLSALEREPTSIVKRTVPAQSILEEVVPLIRPRLQAKGLQLDLVPPPPSLTICGDPDRIVQALLNILDNAAKYTDEGKITVQVTGEEGGDVTFAVSDTGIGIPPSHIGRLGERFYRVDRARSRELGGTGLGLAIVRHIMDVHGGKMHIESTPRRGTTVRLVFPPEEKADFCHA